MLTKLIHPAFVAALLLILVSTGSPASAHLSRNVPPSQGVRDGSGPTGTSARHQGQVAAADSFAPARRKKVRKGKKRRRGPGRRHFAPRNATTVDEGAAPVPSRRTTPAPDRRASDEQEEAAAVGEDAGDEEEEDDRPRPKRRRVSEEEEEEDDEEDEGPMIGMASAVPRLFSLTVGASAIGRKFGFDMPMQRENTFPRLGAVASIELYPLLRMSSNGWHKRFGVGLTFFTEFGSAVLKQSNGASVSIPVGQRRWFGDVRYAILAGDRVLIVPALGVASDFFDLKTTNPGVPPSACGNTSTAPCLADVNTTALSAAAYFRIALTDDVALTLGGAYLLGLSTAGGTGQLASERKAKMSGYMFEVGGNLLLTDWFAVRAAIPFTHFGYTFSGGSAAYKSASETYYGLTVSAMVFTR